MKTSEEILKPFLVNVETLNGNYIMVSKQEAISAMQEYAKQEAIAFNKFTDSNYINLSSGEDEAKWLKLNATHKDEFINDAELYEEYLKSK